MFWPSNLFYGEIFEKSKTSRFFWELSEIFWSDFCLFGVKIDFFETLSFPSYFCFHFLLIFFSFYHHRKHSNVYSPNLNMEYLFLYWFNILSTYLWHTSAIFNSLFYCSHRTDYFNTKIPVVLRPPEEIRLSSSLKHFVAICFVSF